MSKYDGHTPAPWVWSETHVCGFGSDQRLGGGYLNGANGKCIIETDSGCYPPYGPDRLLLADAPLLLRQRDALLEAAKEMEAFISIMVGRGPECEIPATIPLPLGIDCKIGEIMEQARSAIAACERNEQ